MQKHVFWRWKNTFCRTPIFQAAASLLPHLSQFWFNQSRALRSFFSCHATSTWVSINLSGLKMCCKSCATHLGPAEALLLPLGDEQLVHSQVICKQFQNVWSFECIDVFLVCLGWAEGQLARLKTWDVPRITISTGTCCLDEQFASLMNLLQQTLCFNVFHDLAWFCMILVVDFSFFPTEGDQAVVTDSWNQPRKEETEDWALAAVVGKLQLQSAWGAKMAYKMHSFC